MTKKIGSRRLILSIPVDDRAEIGTIPRGWLVAKTSSGPFPPSFWISYSKFKQKKGYTGKECTQNKSISFVYQVCSKSSFVYR